MIESGLMRNLQKAGARLSTIEGVELPKDFGTPEVEYRALREATGVAVRGDLALMRMWGRDPVRMLNGLITNDLGSLEADRAVYALLLTPKGRIISDLRALRWGTADATEILVALPSAALESVSSHLRKYVPPLFARWEPVADQFTTLGIYGPRTAAVLERFASGALPEGEDHVVRFTWDGTPITAISTRAMGGESGYDLVVPSERAAPAWETLVAMAGDQEGRPVGTTALEAARIEFGRPKYDAELTDERLPGEALESTGQMERAVSFTKGCYTGQEVVVRIAHRGHVNRQLRGFLFGPVSPPAAGTPVYSESGKEVGFITSSVHSPRLGQSIGLGYVRREITPPVTVYLGAADGESVEVAELPLD